MIPTFTLKDLEHPSVFARCFVRNACGENWVPREYQIASLESTAERKVHCDGRDVGKTAEIEIMALWAAYMRPNSSMLIATQCENHLFPLMNRLVRRFQIGLLPNSIAELRRSPSWYVRFTNNFELWGRIAGPRGVNFQGMHVDWQIVDEAQEMTDDAWGELFQALNAGGRRWIYGVPNGRRNMFYRLTQMKEIEQYNWPSSLNRDFTAAKDEELAQLYGGRSSPGYIHRVLGQHGSPAYAVFDLEDYLHSVSNEVDFYDVVLRDGEQFASPCDVPPGIYYLGCDLGYARDPSEFVVFRVEEPYFTNVLRVHLEGVNYAEQQRIIQELDAAYRFQSIGIDAGNSGRAVAHGLMALGPEWCEKVRAYDFGGLIDLDPLPDGQPVRRRTKEFMTELLQRRLAEGSLRFPPISDREEQYASHTYSIGATGNTIYEKGNDHIIDADRCAILAHYMDTHVERAPEHVALRPRILGF